MKTSSSQIQSNTNRSLPSTSIKLNVTDNPLHLAVRHGNRPPNDLLIRDYSHPPHHLDRPQSFSGVLQNHTMPAETSLTHEMDSSMKKESTEDILGMSLQKAQCNNGSDGCANPSPHLMNHIRALADMLACPHTGLPINIAMFSRVSAGAKATYLRRLVDELKKLTATSEPTRLQITPLLAMFPTFLAFIIGYVFYIAVGWEIGIALGLAFLFFQIFVIAICLFGTYSKEWPIAISFGSHLTKFFDKLRLLLKVLFYHPPQEKVLSKPVKVIFIHHNLSGYQSAAHALISMVYHMWTATEDKYNTFITRIQSRSSTLTSNRKFKQTCCIPRFIFVVIFLLLLLISLTVIRVILPKLLYEDRDNGRIVLIVIMSCILLACVVCGVVISYRLVECQTKSPTSRLRQMSESVCLYPETMNVQTKTEFKRVSHLINSFDQYQGKRQTRLVVCVDATETFNREELAKFITLCHNLVQGEPAAPVAIVIATDFQVFLGEMSAESYPELVSDSFHLVNNTIHLPIYLEEPCFNNRMSFHQFQTSNIMDSLSNAVSGNVPYNSQQGYPPPPEMTSRHGTMHGPSAPKTITELYVGYNDMSEMNVRIIKNLVASTAFCGRLLRINNIDFKIEDLVTWLTFALHWPYHAAWLTLYIQEQSDKLDSRVTLSQVYERVLTKLGKAQGQLKLLSIDDRDPHFLEIYIKNEAGSALTVGKLRQLIACSAFMNPHMRNCIRDAVKNRNSTVLKQSKKTDSLGEESLALHIETVSPLSGKHSYSWPRPGSSSDLPKTPGTIRRCLVKLKDGYPGKNLSQLTVDEIGEMLSQIEGLSDNRLEDYNTKLRELNITGLVLSVCDMEQLRPELCMTFGDWQLFSTLIYHLRNVENMHEVTTMNEKSGDVTDAEEIADLAATLCTQLDLTPERLGLKSQQIPETNANEEEDALLPTGATGVDDEEETDDAIWKKKRRHARRSERALKRDESEDSGTAYILNQPPPVPVPYTQMFTTPVATLSASGFLAYPKQQFVPTHIHASIHGAGGAAHLTTPYTYPINPGTSQNYNSHPQHKTIREPQDYYYRGEQGHYEARRVTEPSTTYQYHPYKETTLGPEPFTVTYPGPRSYTLSTDVVHQHPQQSRHKKSKSNTISGTTNSGQIGVSKKTLVRAHPKCSQHAELGEAVALLVTEKRHRSGSGKSSRPNSNHTTKSRDKTSEQTDKLATSSSRRRRKLKLVRSLSQSREAVQKVQNDGAGDENSIDSRSDTVPGAPSQQDRDYRRYIPVFYEQGDEEDDWYSEENCEDNECTCEYWYRMEKEGKLSLSEPASRANSRPITSPELSDGEQPPQQTNNHSKRSSHNEEVGGRSSKKSSHRRSHSPKEDGHKKSSSRKSEEAKEDADGGESCQV